MPDSNFDPRDPGPLVLASVYRQVFIPSPVGRSGPLISPDACCIAYTEEQDSILRIGRLDAEPVETRCNVDLARFALQDDSAQFLAWAPNSEFLWTAKRLLHDGDDSSLRRDTSDVRPAQARLDGRLDLLPPLTHDTRPLDALSWAGSDGLAVAKFGTREASEPNPTFAIVDTVRGQVLDALPFAAISPSPWQGRSGWLAKAVERAGATVLSDGRVRLLFRAGQSWVVWTQGQRPNVLRAPYAGENTTLALSPDGSGILMGRHLRTDGWVHTRGYGTMPGKPNEGVLVALYDVETGQERWTIRATAVRDFEFPVPAISPDGRLALVGLMPEGETRVIGLVSMRDGKILQTLPAPGPSYAMGFVRGGRTLWTHAYGVTALYDLRESA